MDIDTRYFFNKITGQFIQLKPIIKHPFSNEWIEIEKQAFDNLLGLRQNLLDFKRYLEVGVIEKKMDRKFCLEKIDSALLYL